MRKIVSIIMILVLSFAMLFVYPAQKASANPLAVGGALYLGGAGVYVLGAVAVGGIVGLAGCSSCQEDIEAHAARTWDGTTQLAKDGLQLMIDSSVGAWGATSSALTDVDANVNSWVNSQIDSLTKSMLGSKYSYLNVTTTSPVYSSSGSNRYANLTNSNTASFISSSGYGYQQLKIFIYSSFIEASLLSPLAGSPANVKTVYQSQMTADAWNALKAQADSIANSMDVMNVATSLGLTFSVGLMSEYNADYTNVRANMTETWEEMVDAGLVLPTDNARPMHNDMPLTYDPVTDAYAGIDGVNVPRDEITFDYQKPHWKTLEDLAMLGLTGLGAGLYIDGWVGSDSVTSTYNPTTDSTTTTTDTTTTHTNVNTGETVTSTTSTTTTTTGDTTGNPTTGEPPPPSTPTATNPFKGKVPAASLLGLWELLVALIWYLIRLFTFVATLALIAPTEITNPYFQWFTTVQILGITPYPLVQNLALFFLGFSIYKSVRRVF